MLKREIFEKAKELAKTACPTHFRLCRVRNNKECYCTAGLVLRAAGYKPILKGEHGVPLDKDGNGSVSWWRSPSHHRIPNVLMVDKFNELVDNRGVYDRVFLANDAADLSQSFEKGFAALTPYVEK